MKNPNLLQEAIIEARELKEAAEKSVKQQLMEELSPLIKKTMENHFSTMLKEQDSSFSIEEEPSDKPVSADSGLDTNVGTLPVNPIAGGVEVTDTASEEEKATDVANPIASDEHSVNIPLPDATGMITVSIEDLFTKPNGVIQALDSFVAPAAVAPEVVETNPEPVPASDDLQAAATDPSASALAEGAKGKFLKLVEYFSQKEKSITSMSPTLAENIQLGLIALCEEGQDLLEKGMIESRDLVLCKKRAEKIQNSVHEKLNSALEQNSYNVESNQKTDGENMAIRKTLKDLFEETEVTFDGLDTEKAKKEADAKQNKLNGQDPGTEDIGEKSKDGDWDKEGATAAASDSVAQKTALEEAIALFHAALNLNEDDEVSVLDGSAGSSDADDSASADGASAGEGEGEGFDIEALLRDFEKQLEDHGISLDSLDVDVAGEKNGNEFDLKFDLDPEGHVEPAKPEGSSPFEGSGEGDSDALVIAEALQTIKKAKSIIQEARVEKHELELYNFKTISLNKLLLKEAIVTTAEKKAAVVALDKGNSLKEVQEIYNRIVAHKQQNDKAARSGMATAGTENSTISESAKVDAATNLNESADPFVTRMQSLAKMK